MSDNTYRVVWPSGQRMHDGKGLARRLDTLKDKKVAELWDWVFKGDKMFEIWEQELPARFPGVEFVSWREFGEIHGANEHQVLAELPDKLRDLEVDAVITAVGC